jgi:hypothetical protein
LGTCQTCGATILFGGVTRDGMKFCKEACAASSVVLNSTKNFTGKMITDRARAIFESECPVCRRPGPLEIYRSHRVISLLVVSFWQTTPRLSCRSCGKNAQLIDLTITSLFGWWGIPHGIIMTPIQIVRNVGGLCAAAPTAPSKELEVFARQSMAAEELANPGSVTGNRPEDTEADAGGKQVGTQADGWQPYVGDVDRDRAAVEQPKPTSVVVKILVVLSFLTMCLPFIGALLGAAAIVGTWGRPSGWRTAAYIATGIGLIPTVHLLLII